MKVAEISFLLILFPPLTPAVEGGVAQPSFLPTSLMITALQNNGPHPLEVKSYLASHWIPSRDKSGQAEAGCRTENKGE